MVFYRHCFVHTDINAPSIKNLMTSAYNSSSQNFEQNKFCTYTSMNQQYRNENFVPVHNADGEVGQVDNQSRLNLPAR
jgi:hypothetical protein